MSWEAIGGGHERGEYREIVNESGDNVVTYWTPPDGYGFLAMRSENHTYYQESAEVVFHFDDGSESTISNYNDDSAEYGWWEFWNEGASYVVEMELSNDREELTEVFGWLIEL